MSKRSAEVELRLRAEQYKAEVESAKVKTEGLDRSVKDVDRDLKKLPPDAAKAAAAMKAFGIESNAASIKLEDGTGKSSTAVGKLEQDLVKARAEVRRFADEFNKTGSSTSLAKMFKASDALSELEKLKGELEKAFSAAGNQGGPGMASKLMKSAASAITSNPELVAAIVAVVAFGAPLIGGALNGVLLSAIGLGGIAIGIAGQMHNPIVHAAATDVANELLNALRGATAPFAVPLAASLRMVGNTLAHLLNSIDFSKLSAALGPLAAGLSMMISKLGPGLTEALSAAVPMLAEFASWLPFIGIALSDMFHEFAGSTSGAKEGLRALMLIVIGSIEAIGLLVGALSNAWSAIVSFGNAASDSARKVFSFVPGLNALADAVHGVFDMLKNGNGNVTQLGRNLHDTGNDAGFVTDAVRKMSDAFDIAFGKAMSLDTAQLQYKTDLLALKDAVQEHGASLDSNSKSGQENRRMLLGLIRDAENTRQAMIDQAGGANASQAAIDKANQQYQTTIDSLDTFAAKLGISRSELDKITGNYGINLLFTTTYRTVGTPPRDLSYGNIPTGRIGGQRWGGVYEHAQDGALRDAGIYSPMSPARYAFAEPATGGEAFIPKYGDARRSTGILSRAAGWYGMDVVPRGMSHAAGGTTKVVHEHRITIDGTGLMKNLRAEIRDQGGNVQLVLGRS